MPLLDSWPKEWRDVANEFDVCNAAVGWFCGASPEDTRRVLKEGLAAMQEVKLNESGSASAPACVGHPLRRVPEGG